MTGHNFLSYENRLPEPSGSRALKAETIIVVRKTLVKIFLALRRKIEAENEAENPKLKISTTEDYYFPPFYPAASGQPLPPSQISRQKELR